MHIFVILHTDEDWRYSKVYGVADSLDKAKAMVINWLKERYKQIDWDSYKILWSVYQSKGEHINCYSVNEFEKDGKLWNLGVLRYQGIEIFEYELNAEYSAW